MPEIDKLKKGDTWTQLSFISLMRHDGKLYLET